MPYRNLLHRGAHLLEASFDAVSARLRHRLGYDDPLHIATYRGYGNGRIVRLGARVLADPAARHPRPGEPLGPLDNLTAMLRRYATDEVPGARVRVQLGDICEEVLTDHEGYLDLAVDMPTSLPDDALWHEVRFELLEPLADEQQERVFCGQVQLPREPRLLVVSDLDDTVVHTGANRLLKYWRTVLFNNAGTRIPFGGVASFYRGLQAGTDGAPRNPIFYLSASPWNFYDLFEHFLALHDIPAGTLLLTDLGIDERKLVRPAHRDHKGESLRRVLSDFPDVPVVLIGDSGQCDPEIYAELAREQPDRIAAIYIRDITAAARDRQVDRIAAQLRELGVPLCRVADSLDAARHACEHGLIDERALRAVEDEIAREGGAGH